MRVLVTGGLGHVGRAVTDILRRDGAEVVRTDRRPNGICHEQTRDCVYYMDIFSNPTRYADLLRWAGPITGIVHCAGVLPSGDILGQDRTTLDDPFRVNVTARALLTAHALAIPDNCIRTVVMLGSVVADKGSTDDLYAASMGGVRSLTYSLMGKYPHVSFHCLEPTLIEGTPAFEAVSEERRPLFRSPAGNYLCLDEVAGHVLNCFALGCDIPSGHRPILPL